MFTYICNVTTR